MGSFFKFGQAVPEIFEFSAQKTNFFLTRLKEGTYIPEMAPKRRFFAIFWEKNTHSFVKNDPNFENQGLFDAKFY